MPIGPSKCLNIFQFSRPQKFLNTDRFLEIHEFVLHISCCYIIGRQRYSGWLWSPGVVTWPGYGWNRIFGKQANGWFLMFLCCDQITLLLKLLDVRHCSFVDKGFYCPLIGIDNCQLPRIHNWQLWSPLILFRNCNDYPAYQEHHIHLMSKMDCWHFLEILL